MGTSAVFALCARSCAPYLPGVLRNLDRLAGLYDHSGFVFVEGDSTDDTRAMLKAWAAGRTHATVLDLGGLDASHPRRTDRLAVCRNAYIQHIKASPLAAYDHLVVLDADEINRARIDLEAFARARDWLVEHDAAAVFANSLPFYYDILALRHPQWCPRDMGVDIRHRPDGMDEAAARQRFVCDRQIPIPVSAQPIEVESAFGGLAIYRMADALSDARYRGLTNSGKEVCEHVRFNQHVARSGRRLFILPWMTVGKQRAGLYSQDSRTLVLEHAGRRCELTGPPEQWLDPIAEAGGPAPGLPALARRIGAAAPGTVAVDLGAGIGEHIALCRLEGADLRFIAIEPSLSRLKYLMINCWSVPDLFAGVEVAWNCIGGCGPRAEETPSYASAPHALLEDILASRTTAPGQLSLVKLRGRLDHKNFRLELAFLSLARPALWISGPADRAGWRRLLDAAPEAWPYALAFDRRGSAVAVGQTSRQQGEVLELLGSHDVALLPERFARVFNVLRGELAVLEDA